MSRADTLTDETTRRTKPIPLVVRAAREMAGLSTPSSDDNDKPARVMPFWAPAVKPNDVVRLDRERLVAQGYVDPAGGMSRLAEEMRIIKRPLMARAFMSDAARRDRVILVTSAMPGEGKTFTAVNLALSLSLERDANVLLVDGDQAMGAAAERLGIPRKPGLSDLLLDPPVDPRHVLVRTSVDRLTFVPPGTLTSELPELVGSRRMTAILDTILAADARRLVVIDAPPVLASSDSLALAALAGQVLFIVAAGTTPREAVDEAIGLIPADRQVQLVLNRVTGGRRYIDYGSYGRGTKPPTRRRWLWGKPSTTAVAIAGAISVAAAPAAPARWNVVPRITIGTAVTDNADLAEKDEKRADIIGEVTPGMVAEGRSERLRWRADYAVQTLTYAQRRDHADVRQKLDAAARAELVSDLAFVDAGGDIGRAFVDNDGPAPRLDFAETSNRATRYAGTLSPFLRRQISRVGDLELRYRLTGVAYDDAALADATGHVVTAAVESGPQPGPLTWKASLAADRVTSDATDEEEAFNSRSFITAVDTSYALGRGWALLGGLGYSRLEDESLDEANRSGPYWNLGIAGRPNSSLRLETRVGQVFQEPTARASAELRLTPTLRLAASYTQGLQSNFGLARSALERAEERDAMRRDEPLDEMITDIVRDDRLAISTNATFRQRRGEVTLQHVKDRTRAELVGFIERRAFDESSTEESGNEDVYGVELGVNRRLTRRTTLDLRTYWSRVSDTEDDRRDHDLGFTASWRYRLTEHARLDLGYDLYRRIAENADEDIVANTVFARFVQEF